MTICCHVKDNLDCLTDQDSLLSPDTQNFPCTHSQEAQSLEGAYLYLDKNSRWWVRSGKAIGRSFVERHDEHKKASQLTKVLTHESKFYTLYPPNLPVMLPAGDTSITLSNVWFLALIGQQKVPLMASPLTLPMAAFFTFLRGRKTH